MIAALGIASAASGQIPGVDPKSLVGEWEGTVTGTSAVPTDVKYYLTMTRADGNKLFGKAQSVVADTFRYESTDGGLSVQLTVDGKRLTGSGMRRGPRGSGMGSFELLKRD